MPEGMLQDAKVAVLVTDGFEQSELAEPKRALEAAGATVAIISPAGKTTVQGMNHDQKADQFQVDLILEEAYPEDFDAVLLPGGVMNADYLRMVPKAQEFVRAMDTAGKPVFVICHGGWLLVSSNLVRNRKMTSYYTLQDDIRNAGGEWVDGEMIRDRNWISSRNPNDLPAFNKAIVSLLTEYCSAGRPIPPPGMTKPDAASRTGLQ